MPANFSFAPSVEAIARPLIREHHEHLIAHQVKMVYLFRDDEPMQNGAAVWGTARKVSGLAAFLGNEIESQDDDDSANTPFFVITITALVWLRLNAAERIALTDHELMHCWAELDKGKVKLSIIAHDFEGFNAEARRYGAWRDNAQQMARAMRAHQPQLFDVADKIADKTTPLFDAPPLAAQDAWRALARPLITPPRRG